MEKQTVEFFKVKGLEDVDINDAKSKIRRKYLGLPENISCYQIMTPNLINIFSTLCPCKEEIKNYTTNALPNELMKELETIMPCFGSIQIWYDDKQKDPVCVATEYSYGIDDKAGHKQEQFGVFATEEQVQEYIEKNNLEGHKPYNYLFSAKQYLIARWGDELKPLSFLAEMAKKRYIISERRKQMKKKLEAEQELAMIELDAEEKFFI